MLYEISTILPTGIEHTSYRPRNRAICNGLLVYKSMPLASIKHLIVCYTNTDDTTLVGGRFELEWYRNDRNIDFLQDCLDIVIEYGEGKPPIPTIRWTIKSIAVLEDGVPLGISDLKELMFGEHVFFSKQLIEEKINESTELCYARPI